MRAVAHAAIGVAIALNSTLTRLAARPTLRLLFRRDWFLGVSAGNGQ
jgi:hypothetical protein